ncbi:MAG TPA: hypothetical protein VGV85_01055 [Longimicrobiaceae bacterium]|nr:hypothetical protein [Longimicrobiaceae bacterium]
MRLQNRVRTSLLAMLLASAPGPRAVSAQADTAWSALYLADLERAHALIAANHPGAVDSANPAFARTLESAYAQARRAAAEVDGYTAYRLGLARFGNAFQDAHLGIGGARPMTGLREAGIHPVFRGGALVVEEVDGRYESLAPALRGATLLDCDGRPADRLLAERVLSWRGRSGVEADRHLLALFGEEWLGRARAWLGDGVYTEWRVSPDNVESARGGARQSEGRHGAGSPQAAAARAFADSLEAALRRGEVLYGARSERRGVPRPPAVALPGRVVVVTGPSCFSACLDFLDRMRLHPAVVQVGEVTGVDTDYMENWGQRLPSGLSGIGYPMKVYRNRRRAADQAYAPHVRYGGPLRDTAALRTWIRENHARW